MTRKDLPHALVLFAVVFVAYVATMPRTVTLEDSGGFILSSYYAGISHPPGYPLHSLLGKLFTLLPVGSVALRVHLLSALLGALSCVLLAWVVRLLGGTRTLAWGTALLCAFSEVFWSQAIIAEVYTLHTFLLFLAFGLCLRFDLQGRRRDILLAAFGYGLCLSNYWPLTVLATPAFLVCLWSRRAAVPRMLLPALLCFLAGMTPFLYVWLRSLTNPEISFYGPIDTLDKFLYFVLRRNYGSEPGQATAAAGSRLQFLGFFAGQTLRQFTVAGAALAVVGCWAQWTRWPRRMALAWTLGFLATTAFLLVFLEFQDDFFHRAVARVFPMTSYCFLALWVALGLQVVLERLAGWTGLRRTAWLQAASAAVLVSAVFASHVRANDRHHDTWAMDFAKAVLGSLDPGAVIFTHGDVEVGTLGYAHYVEKVRPDVAVYHDAGLTFGNRLFVAPAFASPGERVDTETVLRQFVGTTDRPVYYFHKLPNGFHTTSFGLFRRADRGRPPGMSFSTSPALLDFFDHVLDATDVTDPWVVDHRNHLIGAIAETLAPIVHATRLSDAADPRHRQLLDRACRHYMGSLHRIQSLREVESPQTLMRWVQETEALQDDQVNTWARARLHDLKGVVYARMGRAQDAEQEFLRSMEIHAVPDVNLAIVHLLDLYAREGRSADLARLERRFFPGGRTTPATVTR